MIRLDQVSFTPAPEWERRRGLLGFLKFVLPEGLLVDGVALRRSPDGRYLFTWPAKKDRFGRERHHVRPLDDEARRAIEGELLDHLKPWLRGGAA